MPALWEAIVDWNKFDAESLMDGMTFSMRLINECFWELMKTVHLYDYVQVNVLTNAVSRSPNLLF